MPQVVRHEKINKCKLAYGVLAPSLLRVQMLRAGPQGNPDGGTVQLQPSEKPGQDRLPRGLRQQRPRRSHNVHPHDRVAAVADEAGYGWTGARAHLRHLSGQPAAGPGRGGTGLLRIYI